MRLFSIMYKKLCSNIQYIEYLRRGGVKIGNSCSIEKSVIFGSEPYLITIGNNVRITHGVKFITHDGGLWVARNLKLTDENADLIAPIKVGNNVNIGWDAIIMPGITIGDNCVVGCNAVVTHDVPPNSIVAGVPARVIESIDEYVQKNQNRLMPIKHLSNEKKKEYLIKLYS